MPGEAMPFYWRRPAIELVRAFAQRDDDGRHLHSRTSPVLVLCGPRDIGKTPLQKLLERLVTANVPYSAIDCATFSGGPRQLLAQVAFELHRETGAYRSLPLPRLLAGMLAIEADISLDPLDLDIARSQLRAFFAARRRSGTSLETATQDILQAVIGSVPLPAVVPATWIRLISKYGGSLIAKGLLAARRDRRLRREGLRWWGHQGRPVALDPMDALIGLRRGAADADATSPQAGSTAQREIAVQLWAAFLADLQAAFGDRRAWRWTLNCVLLLDNADAPAGREFLTELTSAREKQVGGEPDPLTVVATTRSPSLVLPAAALPVPLAGASRDDYARRAKADRAVTWWYPVALSPLDWQDVRDIVTVKQFPAADGPVLASAIHGFTGGLPGAVQILLFALGPLPPGQHADLPGLLGAPTPQGQGRTGDTVEETLLRRLTSSLADPAALQDLVTCAAARDRTEADSLGQEGLLAQFPRGDEGAFTEEFWRGGPPGGPLVLHPLLRRLLLRQLASRGNSPDSPAEPDWATVHERLRSASRDNDDITGALYHALALGRLEEVAGALAATLRGADARDWLAQVARVTAAPRNAQSAPDPRAAVSDLTRWTDGLGAAALADPIRPVARLAAWSWLGCEALNAPSWPLILREMAHDLELLQQHVTAANISALRDEAQRYRVLAGSSWREVTAFWAARAAGLPSTR